MFAKSVKKCFNLPNNDYGGPLNKAMNNAETLNHAFFRRIIKTVNSNLCCLPSIYSLRNTLDHSVKKSKGSLSDDNTVINLVLEGAQINFFDESLVNFGHCSGCLLNYLGISFCGLR